MRPRLLPATMALTGILLAGKLAGLVLALVPQGVVPAAAAAPSREDTATPPTSAGREAVAKTSAPPLPAATAVTAAPLTAPAANPDAQPAPSASERALLQELRARRRELDGRDQALATREGVLAAAEQKLDERVAQLAALQARLEQLDRDRRAHDEANWAGLVKTYEAMKPREAAVIFDDMDMAVLLPVLDRMKEAKAAAVLGAMQPDRARLATAQLAAMRTRAITTPAG